MNQNESKGLGELVGALCQTNTDLWHEEDKARCQDNNLVAQAKRNVDKLNQKRNDLIEKIDDFFIAEVKKRGTPRG